METSRAFRCSKCRIAFFCGSQCQRMHWTEHRKRCKNPTSRKKLLESVEKFSIAQEQWDGAIAAITGDDFETCWKSLVFLQDTLGNEEIRSTERDRIASFGLTEILLDKLKEIQFSCLRCGSSDPMASFVAVDSNHRRIPADGRSSTSIGWTLQFIAFA